MPDDWGRGNAPIGDFPSPWKPQPPNPFIHGSPDRLGQPGVYPRDPNVLAGMIGKNPQWTAQADPGKVEEITNPAGRKVKLTPEQYKEFRSNPDNFWADHPELAGTGK